MMLVWWWFGCGGPAPQSVLWGPKLEDLGARGGLLIQPGTFKMGTILTEEGRFDSERIHTVTLTRPFAIGATEVTQAQYQAVMGSNPSQFTACGPNCPVEKVNFFDALTFCNRLSAAEGLTPAYEIEGEQVRWNREANGYRLPTEAEWEYAARGGDRMLFGSSNDPMEAAWFTPNARGSTHPVGQLKPNPWGLYDVSGNVREWVWDTWTLWDEGRPQTDPVSSGPGPQRVSRGGSWSGDASRTRVAYRRPGDPNERTNHQGFRLARNAPAAP